MPLRTKNLNPQNLPPTSEVRSSGTLRHDTRGPNSTHLRHQTTIPFATNKGGGGVGSSDDGWTRADLPILLALRDGEIIAWSSGLRDFRCAGGGEDSIESDAVERWFDRAGSLILDLPNPDELCGIRPEEDAILMNMRQMNGLGRVMRFRVVMVRMITIMDMSAIDTIAVLSVVTSRSFMSMLASKQILVTDCWWQSPKLLHRQQIQFR